ncbi:MAG: PAS domain-containing protein [Nanoarchaeota archaeon]|nr:PAS domain-containing protein [Thermodesulfovibrionia bacterium]MCK5281892.1 PAS domain-containing protein [Nanoarchaeota archaeon]
MEEELKKAAEEWKRTFDSMVDGISIHTTDFKIRNVNVTMCNMFGKKKEEMIGKKCYEVFHGKRSPLTICPQKRAITSKKRQSAEFFEPLLNKWVSVTSSPVLNGQGGVIELVHIVRDITDKKNEDKIIQGRNEELERFHKLAVGRELKMIELKKRIMQLEKSADGVK